MMKRLFSLFILVLATIGFSSRTYAQQDLLDLAAAQYDSAHYQTSIDAYEQVIQTYGASPEVYYNLAGAYYKLKEYPKAIVNYERCLLYDPSNADAATNLDLARLQCVDKIETIEPVFFVTWSNNVRDMLSCDAWGVYAILFFLLFIVCCFAYFFGRAIWMRKAGFFIGLLAILLTVVSLRYAQAQNDRIMQREYAVVMTPSVVVRSSPAESGTQLFTIHEGLKVRVRSTLSGWSEIELSDGNVGWMPSTGLEII